MSKVKLGQHFLKDENVLNKLISMINPKEDDIFVEVGPGKGRLTIPLLKAKSQVIAIEKDKELAADLPEVLQKYKEQITIITQDAAKGIHSPQEGAWRLVGNLPYEISSPIMNLISKLSNQPQDCHFMLQYEFAKRLVAKHDTKEYGRLSIFAQAYYDITLISKVEPRAFRPPPKVDSALVRLVPNETYKKIINMKLFEDIIRAAFVKRRKVITNALAGFGIIFDKKTSKLRAENISLDKFIELSNQISKKPTS